MSDNKRDFEDIEFVAEANDNKTEKKKSKKGKDKKPKRTRSSNKNGWLSKNGRESSLLLRWL